MANVDDYYKELAARPKPNMDKYSNLQTKQNPQDLSPADGGEGFIGSNTGEAPGFAVVEGKKGSVENRPIWSEQSSFTGEPENAGSADTQLKPSGTDSTDETASYKKVQTDEGLPQTYRDSFGAGDAGPAGGDEPDNTGQFGKNARSVADGNYATEPLTQSTPDSDSGDHELSDMPQTEFTHYEGGGAPHFKRG